LRFFKERRIPVTFVDLAVKPLAPTELRRFTSRYGAGALIDEHAPAFRNAGLGYMRLNEDESVERVLKDQRLLRLPLVRSGNAVVVGFDERALKELLTTQ
jgi:arsenate reductase (glutaredoxin)